MSSDTPECPGISSRHLVLIAGPSGAGKDTLISLATERIGSPARVHVAKRTVTRPENAHENHECVSEPVFEAMERDGIFALVWRAHGLAYGIRTSEIERPGQLVVASVSRCILREARSRTPRVSIVLITAPPAILRQRIAGRGRRDDDMESRLSRLELSAEMHELSDLVIDNSGPPENGARALENFLRTLMPTSAEDGR